MDLIVKQVKQQQIVMKLEAIEHDAKMLNDGVFTEAQRAEYDKLLEESKPIEAEIDRLSTRLEAEKASVTCGQANWLGITPDDWTLSNIARSGAPRPRGRLYADLFADTLTNDGWSSSGEFLQCIHAVGGVELGDPEADAAHRHRRHRGWACAGHA